ncbi:tetraspanin-33 [Nematostella vectensis]|uniref:tetraspanin-33 n=1 Tax=Nematostella vectensis TaxID=45351 RepID=UPI00138FA788|nr:tetraspanin-33 [Nematostella vectensis]
MDNPNLEAQNVISKCLKYFLFVFNLLFWAIGGVMFGVGMWSVTQKGSYSKLSSLSTDPGSVLIAVGLLIIIISFFGTVGALREQIILLEIYKWVIVVIVILQVLGGLLAFAFWPNVRKSVQNQISKGIVNYRDNLDLQNIIDGIQENFKCCGSSSINDWDANRYFKCGGPSPEECGVPHTCCVKKDGESINIQCGWNARKKHRLQLEKENKVYIIGCLDAVINWFRDHMYVVAAIAIAFALPEFAGIILTHIFVQQIKEQIDECNKPPMYKYRPETQPLSESANY